MKCPHASEIKRTLSSPPRRALLQHYADLVITDPWYFAFHEVSTLLSLRQELGLPFGGRNVCDGCERNTLAKCALIPVLNDAIVERTGDKGSDSL